MTQRQHLQKQREAQLASASMTNTPVNINLSKEPKATIVIKTPTMQSAANVKGSMAANSNLIEKKNDVNWDPVPPLAPLSGNNSIRQTSIIASIPTPTISPSKIDDDSNSTNQSANSSIYGTNPTTPSCHGKKTQFFI